MKMVCSVLGHLPGAQVRNEGLIFSTCVQCEKEIISQPGCRWNLVPRGVRVAWYPSGHRGVHWKKVIGPNL